MKLTLRRLTFSPDHPTHGMLMKDNTPLCATLEQPWRDNANGVSCIPPGTYQCIPHDSEKFPHTWEVSNVTDREAILLHCGNTVADTHGCILVGQYFTGDFLMSSRLTLEKLRNELTLAFELEIMNP